MTQKDNVMNPIYSRRSIRKYKPDIPEQNVIEQIIDAGRMAPSAKNRQPWFFHVYSGNVKEELLLCMKRGIENEECNPSLPKSNHGIADAKNTLRIMEEAPVIIMIVNTNGKSPFESLDADGRFAEINDLLSIGASIENMILMAEKMGLGSLWIGNTCFAYKELYEYMGMEGHLVGAVALGYKNETPQMRPRKRLEEIAEFHK